MLAPTHVPNAVVNAFAMVVDHIDVRRTITGNLTPNSVSKVRCDAGRILFPMSVLLGVYHYAPRLLRGKPELCRGLRSLLQSNHRLLSRRGWFSRRLQRRAAWTVVSGL